MLLLLLAACQAKAEKVSDPVQAIEVRSNGNVIASVRPGHPCRATVATSELLVGHAPLIAQDGDVRWSGETRDNGTMISRDGTPVARLLDRATTLDIYDPQGIAIVRIAVGDGSATVADRANRLVHRAVRKGSAIEVTPSLAVTGTDDLALAALLSASEVQPEVRMLAACEHLAKGAR